jgi:hypothetical protein
MTKPIRKGAQIDRVRKQTLNAHETKNRVHAIVGQVLDELERRRVNGKSDYVAALADNLAAGDLAAWKVLRDLLPRDELESSGAGANVKFGPLFAMVVQQMGERERHERQAAQPTALLGPSEKIIDVPVQGVIETNVEEGDGQGAVDW